MIRKGFGIITGLTKGSLHPSYFVNAMTKHLNTNYYVGLLSAASHWGASHQAPMTCFIIADKVIKPIVLKRMNIKFVTKRNIEEASEVAYVSGIGGYFYVSEPELTAIDLMRFPQKSGHLNNIATVLNDLVDRMDMKKLSVLCDKHTVPTVTLQRLGYLFDRVLHHLKASKCIENILQRRKISSAFLSVVEKPDRSIKRELPYDKKWQLYQNVTVEPD